MMMARLQLSMALLCLCCYTSLALYQDSTFQAQIRKEVKFLQKEKLAIAHQYVSTRDFNSKVLDKGMALVEHLEEMVQEYGIEEEFPSVAKFVENLKVFVKDTKEYSIQHLNTLADEFEQKEEEIKSQLLKLLEN